MHRRSLLIGAACLPLAAPSVRASEGARVIRFVPNGDLPVLDPIANTVMQTRTHGYMVWDTLYGTDANFQPQPQMVEGHLVEQDGKQWTLTLRPGLRFHDGEPVLARDVTASLRRWHTTDAFGQALFAATDELSEVDDRTIRFRLRSPFPLLPQALGKMAPCTCVIMPARICAGLPPTTPVKEIIGSGPFRFKADERVSGARYVYERFEGYVPRESGVAQFTSGPKRVYVDRVEWLVMPESASSVAAIQAGEVDWLEMPAPDLLPLLRADPNLVVRVNDQTGSLPVLRFNCIQPPFDNAGVRKAVLSAVNQADFLAAFSSDTSLQRHSVGVFTPGTPMANDAGLEALAAPASIETARRAVAAAGYHGETAVVLGASDHPVNGVMSQVGADLLKKLGITVEYREMDAGTMFQARANRNAPDKGGWSVFPTSIPGIDLLNPMTSNMLGGTGLAGWYGWPTDPLLETLRADWMAAPDQAAELEISRKVQREALKEATFIPLGQILQPTATRKTVTGMLPGFAKFWEVRKA